MQKGAIPKACKKHTKIGKREGEDEKRVQSIKQKNVQKANRLKGAIRVQLGCNQGAKGCNPKSVQKHAKTGPVGRTSIKTELGEPVSKTGLGEPVSGPSGLGEPSPSRWVSKTQQKGPLPLFVFF